MNNKKKIKILWCDDYYEGPRTGICIYNDQKLWFRRIEDDLSVDIFSYELHLLTDEMMRIVEEEHIKYCDTTGEPKVYGGIKSVKRTDLVVAKNKEVKDSDPDDELKSPNLMFKGSKYQRYDTMHVTGKVIDTVTEEDFSNLYVPHVVTYL